MSNKVSRVDDVRLLIDELNTQYSKIDELCRLSIVQKHIPDALKIKIKHFLGDAQSILDYCACDIGDHYELIRLYITGFPVVYRKKDLNLEGFEKRLRSKFKGSLKMKDPALFNYLESIQPYHSDYIWFGHFWKIINEFKHIRLAPQSRIETPELEMEYNGLSITVTGKGQSFSLPPNTSISMGGAPIFGGKIITADSQPDQIRRDKRINIKKQIWVNIVFDGTEISVLGLIKKINSDIPKIAENVYKLLGRIFQKN